MACALVPRMRVSWVVRSLSDGLELLPRHDVDAGRRGLGAEHVAGAHAEGARVVQHGDVLDALLLEEVEQAGHDLDVVHGGLEHPRAVLHRLHQAGGARHAHERHLGALDGGNDGQADIAPVAVADDHVHLVLLDEALGGEHGLGRLAGRVVERELDRRPPMPPFLLASSTKSSTERFIRSPRKAAGPGVGEDAADPQGSPWAGASPGPRWRRRRRRRCVNCRRVIMRSPFLGCRAGASLEWISHSLALAAPKAAPAAGRTGGTAAEGRPARP